jgi:hypothetical protein
MASLYTILDHLGALLRPDSYDDYGPNGLQVPGRESVEVVVTGVSANAELFTRAREQGADLVLVHHGLFWGGPPRALDRASKRRLQLLFDADMSLAAYHLPLDGHLEHGNNALLAAAIGCEGWDPFGAHKGATIGVAGRLPADGIAADELVARVHAATGREPLSFTDDGPRARERDPLRRRRPLRHGDLRRAPPRRPAGRAVRRPARLRRRAEPHLSRVRIATETCTSRRFPLLMSAPRAICAGRCKRPRRLYRQWPFT